MLLYLVVCRNMYIDPVIWNSEFYMRFEVQVGLVGEFFSDADT